MRSAGSQGGDSGSSAQNSLELSRAEAWGLRGFSGGLCSLGKCCGPRHCSLQAQPKVLARDRQWLLQRRVSPGLTQTMGPAACQPGCLDVSASLPAGGGGRRLKVSSQSFSNRAWLPPDEASSNNIHFLNVAALVKEYPPYFKYF